MKVVLISKYYPPSTDGVGDHTFKLIQFFKKYNLHFRLITSVRTTDKNIYYNPLAGIKDGIKLFFLLKKLNPDVIILQYIGYSFQSKGCPFWLIILLKIIKKKGLKIVSIIHETHIRAGYQFKTRIISFLQQRCLMLLLKISHTSFTSIERYLKQCKHYQKNTFLLRIGSNIEPNLIINTHLNTGKQYLVIWGNRDHTKALHIFKAFKESTQSEVTLKIIGKISHVHLNKINLFLNDNNAIKKDISLTGILEESELSKLLSMSLGIIMIEHLENGEGGFSLKSGVSVAAIRHKMLIFTNQGDMTDSFLKSRQHLIFLPASLNDSAKIIQETLINSVLISAIKNNLGKIQTQFKWENIVKTVYHHL